MCAGTRGAQCVYVPYVLSVSLEFLRAVARVCGVPVSLLRMWCSAWAVVSCCVTVAWIFCGRGATLVAARETQCLPALRGSNQRAAAPATLFRPPGRPCRKESQTFGLIPFQILWIATAVGCQSTHSGALAVEDNQPSRQPVLLEPETTAGQPAPVSTKAPGTRDHCRATSPRVYKSSWNPRPLQSNQPPCLQKFLDLEPSRATGPRDYNKSSCPRPQRATGPRVCKSSSKTRSPGDNQSHRDPDLPFSYEKMDYPSRHALHKVRTEFSGNREIKDNQSSNLRESDDLDTRRQPANLSTPAQLNSGNQANDKSRTPDHTT